MGVQLKYQHAKHIVELIVTRMCYLQLIALCDKALGNITSSLHASVPVT